MIFISSYFIFRVIIYLYVHILLCKKENDIQKKTHKMGEELLASIVSENRNGISKSDYMWHGFCHKLKKKDTKWGWDSVREKKIINSLRIKFDVELIKKKLKGKIQMKLL